MPVRYSGHLESIDALDLMGRDVLAVGWERGWVTLQDVIRFALDRLLSEAVAEEDKNAVMSLALAESEKFDHLDIKQFLNRLIRNSF